MENRRNMPYAQASQNAENAKRSGQEPQKPENKPTGSEAQKRKELITMYTVVTVFTCIVAAVIFILAAIVCKSQFSVYMKFVFIPLFSFIGGFANTHFLKKCRFAPLIVLAVSFLSHLIFAGFEWKVFLWLILYFANWIIGVIIAILVSTYVGKGNKQK